MLFSKDFSIKNFLKFTPTVGLKLALLLNGLIGAISLFIYFYFPVQYEHREIKALAIKAKSISEMTAFSVAPAVFFDDLEAMEEAVSAAKLNTDLEYLYVLKDSLTIKIDYHHTHDDGCWKPGEPFVNGISTDERTFGVVTAIVLKNQQLGLIVIGLSLDDVKSRIAEIRKTIAQVSVIVFIVGMIAIYGISTILTRPLRKIAATANQIAEGDLSKRTAVYSSDEIGLLANAFNTMVSKLEMMYMQVNEAKELLEGRVIERTRQLIDEIDEWNRIESAGRESDGPFRMLFSEMTSGFILFEIVLDNNGLPLDFICLDVNAAFEKLIGLRREQVIGQKYSELIGESDLLEIYKNVSITGQPHQLQFFYSGTSRQFEVRIFRPQPKKLAILFNDITEQQKAEELLRQRQKMESLGILAGGIAHDFNNLLQAMLGQLSIAMTKMETSNPAYSNIEKGQKAAIRAAELTQQLLAYSGRGKFQIVPINLTELIRENMHLFEVSIPKNVVIRTNFDSTLIVINGDPGQIQQIIMNLIINAGEAIGLRQGEIQISTRRKRISESETQDWDKALEPPRPGEYAIIEVKDNGCGMNDETLSRIFDPFFTTKFTGRGLGLAAVLGIIRGHKGGMLVESKVYKGTTFRIALPLAETELQENGEEKISGNLFDGAVLIIDDEDFVREFVTDVLEMESIKAISAGSGEEGVKIYRNHCTEIKVVLLDLSMPGMGGKETFEELKKINSQVKVVLSSGYSETEATSRFTRDGLVGFIQKPYKPDTLLKILQKLI